MGIISNSNKFDRNAAFTMNLVNPESDVADAAYCITTLKGSLLIFNENSIVNVSPAEVVDPYNKEPETRHSSQFIYQIGSTNRCIARTILQSKNIMDSVILNKGFDKQNILDHIWDCTQHLIECEKSFISIVSDTIKLTDECNKIVTQGKTASHIPSLPQVKDIEQRVVAFLGNGKRLLEKSHRLLCIFYGVDYKNSNFQAYRDWMLKHKPSKKDIIALLNSNKDWIQLLAWYRNALDINHSKHSFKVVIENFKLRAGNKFTNPCWQYDFSDKENGKIQDKPHDLVGDMNMFIVNMFTFFEELFLLCVKDNWDVQHKFKICQHKNEDINAKCPVSYYISM